LRIGVLNNLRAGRAPDAQRVFELLKRRSDVLHVETERAHEVGDALAELERAEVDVLVIHGGDGTVQLALSELLRDPRRTNLPAIAPLRGGRTNCTSTDLGADRHPAVGLARLLEAADAGQLDRLAVSRPVLRLRSSRRSTDHYGMFFGAGLIYRAIQVVHRMFPPGRQGTFGASIVTGALVLKVLVHPTQGILAPDKCEVREQGRELADPELYLLIASTLDRLFLRMNPFWGTGPGGVRLTALSSRAQRIWRAAPGILRGRPPKWVSRELGYTSERLEDAKLRISCGFTIDGELFAPEPEEEIELSADRRIRFLRA
jgi:diacylglycerol kinase-like protein